MDEKPQHLPKFASEAEEAQWWYEQRDQLSAKAEVAYARGELRLRQLATTDADPDVPVTSITVRLSEQDLARAQRFAAKQGIRYQTYVKMLLHEALDSEEKRLIG